jgi:hypothetical protein
MSIEVAKYELLLITFTRAIMVQTNCSEDTAMRRIEELMAVTAKSLNLSVRRETTIYRVEYRERTAPPFIWAHLSTSDYHVLDDAKVQQSRVDSMLVTRVLEITTRVVA